jgi:CBS domain containing-hemolysin-like protein
MFLLLTILFPLLLSLSAFFSSSETACFALDPLRARRFPGVPDASAARIRWLLSKPTRLLSTILVGNTIVNIALSNVGYALAHRLCPAHAEAAAVATVTILLVLFGEVGPKRVGLRHAAALVRLFSPVLAFLVPVFAPLRALLEAITARFARAFRPRGKTLSEEEFETVLDISREEGVLNTDELAMIKAIVDLEDLHASDVMTPRVDFIGIDLDDPACDPVASARRARRNFLIVYHSHYDEIAGFLDTRRFLLDPRHDLPSALLPPVYVPESVPLNRLLSRFQREHLRITAVVDEYGGVAGLVTRGDILEEITGDVYNELSKPRPIFQPAGPHAWLVDANISLEELNRKLRVSLEAETSDRLAGWIAERLGAVPSPGDVVQADGVRVRVMQAIKLRVTLAHVEKLSPSAP